MPLTSTNFTAGKMNKSLDERLIPPGEYIDAMNVRLGSTETTEIGAVENSMGNTILTNLEYANAPLGSPRTIGVYEDGINETLYWFVNDEANPNSPTGKVDLILSFNTNTGSLTYHVISTSVLNFDKDYLITGVNKIENLLFFTDDINPPRVINVGRAYDTPVGGIDTIFEEEDVSVIVKPPGYEDFDPSLIPPEAPPLGCPHVAMKRLVGQENYMETRFLSFAYRYRYEDGGYSAVSLFSSPAFQPQAFQFSIQDYTNAGMKNQYNACDITFSTGSRRVIEIDLLYKQTTSNVINIIKRFNKQEFGWADNGFETLQFANSEIYTTLGSDELLRLYDNVPRTAKAQTIQGKRLIYANYVDGYDMTFTEGGTKVQLDYNTQPLYKEITGEAIGDGSSNPIVSSSTYGIGGIGSQGQTVLTWDLTNANPPGGGVILAGTTFNFRFSIEQVVASGQGNGPEWFPGGGNTFQQPSPFNISMSFICPVNYNNVTDMCASPEFEDRIGGTVTSPLQTLYPCNDSAAGGTLSDKFYGAAVTPMTATNFVLISGGITAGDQCTLLTFPLTCSTAIITSGTTDAATPGQLTNTLIDFGLAGVVAGDIIMDMSTGLIATVTTTPVSPQDFLLLTPGDGGELTLVDSGVNYQIVSGAGSGSPCTPAGFNFTALAGGFSVQVPATQYYYDDNAGNVSNAFLSYKFIAYGCSAGYLTTSDTGSLHSNRDYETGIVYMDEYGRSSTVLVSNTNTCFIEPAWSVYKNRIKVELLSLPPYWAKKYKFVVKPSEGTYMTIYSNLFYPQDGTGVGGAALLNDPSLVWFKLEGNNQNLVEVGQELIVKVDTAGAVLSEQKCTVLAVESFGTKEITGKSLKGLYMCLKPSGWTIEATQQNYYRGTKDKEASDTGDCTDGCINNYDLNDDASPRVPYTIPAGSTIRIRIHNWRGGGGGSCDSKDLSYDKTFVSTADYPNFWSWSVGDDLQGQMTCGQASNCNETDISFNPALTSGSACTYVCFHSIQQVRQLSNGEMYFSMSCGIPSCWEWFEYYNGHCSLLLEVSRGGALLAWETVPLDADPNLFYDASDLLDIAPLVPGGQPYHQANKTFIPASDSYILADGSQDQGPGVDLRTVLDFYNCYTFGNGIESFRIQDSPAGKTFNLGERVLAVSNQDFKEADRFAGMTYSGVYSGAANSNNLNEFNLGLVNFKDCEVGFGPIMKLHSRETDILCLQEDRISYVLASKNVITDSTGGGAIASVPQVLGTQIARIEEYGISFNPESFAAWGYDMFFTDTKRGAVINLRGSGQGSDQLQVVSNAGMHSWFRERFNAELTTQKLGGYDPYMKEYVLSANGNPVPIPIPKVPCGQAIVQMAGSATITYEVDLGLVIGVVDVPYVITSGSITINIEWNGTTYTSGAVSSNGSFSFNKSCNTPSTAMVEIIPSVVSNYNVTVECPPEVPVTVFQVVINTENYDTESTHIGYNWTDSCGAISPFTTIATILTLPQAALWETQTGIKSLGIFPHDGADIIMRIQKIAPDNFDFDPARHKLRAIAGNTLYADTGAGRQAMLAASFYSVNVQNPSPGTYSANMGSVLSPGDQYLYLIWDLRLISNMVLCKCDASLLEACCICGPTLPCPTCWFGPQTSNLAQACATDTDHAGSQQLGFSGSTGGLPNIGNIVYNSTTCYSGTPVSGVYIVDANSPATSSPKNWIEINNIGVVINTGTC